MGVGDGEHRALCAAVLFAGEADTLCGHTALPYTAGPQGHSFIPPLPFALFCLSLYFFFFPSFSLHNCSAVKSVCSIMSFFSLSPAPGMSLSYNSTFRSRLGSFSHLFLSRSYLPTIYPPLSLSSSLSLCLSTLIYFLFHVHFVTSQIILT